MVKTGTKRVLLGLIIALVSVSLSAQSVVSINPGTYQGSLGGSSRTFDGYRGQEYSLRVQSGVEYQIDLVSSDFDTYLVAFRPDGTRLTNDDGGSGLNSRLVITPNSSGTMRIIARSFSRSPSGSFTLTVAQASSGGSLSSRSVGLGNYSGNLTAASGEYEGYRADEYRVNVSANTQYQIDLMSSDFDAYLVVIHPDGSSYRNDDGGSGLDSRLVTTPSSSGTMRIIARSFGRTPNGNYTMTVVEAGGGSMSSRSVGPGTYSGNLTGASGEHEGYRADEYQVNVSANTQYEIALNSSDFDAYLVVIHPDGSSYRNDDGGSGLNSRLVTTPSSSGTMRVIARSFGRTPTGNYTLSINASETAGGGQMVPAGTRTGTLTTNSSRFDGYRGQEFFVPVSANRSYEINLTSSDFDTYLVVFHPDGTRYTNDDGGSGLNSRLVTTPRSSGDMRIIARGYLRDATGTFTLETQQQ